MTKVRRNDSNIVDLKKFQQFPKSVKSKRVRSLNVLKICKLRASDNFKSTTTKNHDNPDFLAEQSIFLLLRHPIYFVLVLVLTCLKASSHEY